MTQQPVFIVAFVSALAVAAPAQATSISYSAELAGLDTKGSDGETYVWSGGLITGYIDVESTPYLVNTNPSTDEVAARFAFTGSLELDGTPLSYRYVNDGPSYITVFHSPDPSEPDSIRFEINVDPFQVASNLELLNFGFQTAYSDTLSYNSFPSLIGLTIVQEGLGNYNLASTNGQIVFGSPLLSYEVTPVPLPAAFPLYASGLGLTGLFGLWRRRRAAA